MCISHESGCISHRADISLRKAAILATFGLAPSRFLMPAPPSWLALWMSFLENPVMAEKKAVQTNPFPDERRSRSCADSANCL